MPVSLDGNVQTDSYDGRKFITLKVAGTDGKPVYRKVQLQTRDRRVAKRRASALEGVRDPEVARRIVHYLADSPDEQTEAHRLAEFRERSATLPLVSSVTFDDARNELGTLLADFGEPEPDVDAVKRWQRASSPNEQRAELLRLRIPDRFLSENPDVYESFKRRATVVNPNFDGPPEDAISALFRGRLSPERIADTLAPDRPARGPKLSKCIEEFRTDQAKRDLTAKHTKSYVNKFQAFVDFVGDKPIRSLTKGDFVRFGDHVEAVNKGKTNKTIIDNLRPVGAVLIAARTRMDDGVFPDGLDNWLQVFSLDKRPYKPARSNKEPIPVDVFQSLLAKADEWANLDWRAYADSLPVSDGKSSGINRSVNERKAKASKRHGLLCHVGLCLSANVGATAIDFARLKWSELTLTGKLPLFTQPRTKTETNEDMIIPVKTPLLPETVRSLQRWKAWQDSEGGSDFVFTNEDVKPFDGDDAEDGSGVTKIFKRVRDAVNCNGWEARHCRNIGATLQRDHGLPEAMATAWLRHAEGGTNVFYRGVAKDHYLAPLVRIIDETYFAKPKRAKKGSK